MSNERYILIDESIKVAMIMRARMADPHLLYSSHLLLIHSVISALLQSFSWKNLLKPSLQKIPGSKEFQDLTASTWVNTTCKDIQTAIIKRCAYNNRSAFKILAFGEEYDKLYPGSIYFPPSYNENFPTAEG